MARMLATNPSRPVLAAIVVTALTDLPSAPAGSSGRTRKEALGSVPFIQRVIARWRDSFGSLPSDLRQGWSAGSGFPTAGKPTFSASPCFTR